MERGGDGDGLHNLGLLPRTRYSTKTELVFRDLDSAVRIVEAGATVVAAQKKGRSGTIHRLHATAMAFWGEPYETWTALDAAVPDTTEIAIESTANGAGGLFYEMVLVAVSGGLPRMGPGPDAAGIPGRRRELLSHGGPAVFRRRPDRRAVREGRPAHPVDQVKWQGRLLGQLQVFELPPAGLEYIVGGDVSEGTGNDAHSATVLEKRSGRTVATFWPDSIEPGDFGLAMALIGWSFNTALLAPERNNHGHAAIRAIVHEAKYPVGRVYRTPDGKLGWSTDAVTRPVMIDELAGAVRTRVVTTPDRATVAECKALVRDDKGKVEARDKHKKGGGCKDDRWISWCIAFQVRSAPSQEIRATHMPGF